MGSVFSRTATTIAPVENQERDHLPVDKRKRNSLVWSVVDWVDAEYGRDAAKVESLLGKRSKRINHSDPRGSRAAKVAESIARGNMRTLRETVIAHFPQINKKYIAWANDTLLHVVCREGYLRMVEFIVDPKNVSQFDKTVINYNAENEKRRTPLHVAFAPPHETFCGKTLGVENGLPRSKRPEDLISGDHDWVKPGTPEDRQDIIEVLVSKGADPNRLDYHDYSPLHYACVWGWVRTTRFLLEHGANPEGTTITGQNALMTAAEFRHPDLVELLIDDTTVPLEAKNVDGETALHYAIAAADVASVELLCQFGANTNAASYAKDTALRRACRANNADIINILLDFRVARDDAAAFELLQGEAKSVILERLRFEQEEKQRQFEAAQTAAIKLEVPQRGAGGRPLGPRSEVGQWLPYRDKRGRGIFYYNKVSRASQFEVPVDYVTDPNYVMRDATFGMHFQKKNGNPSRRRSRSPPPGGVTAAAVRNSSSSNTISSGVR